MMREKTSTRRYIRTPSPPAPPMLAPVKFVARAPPPSSADAPSLLPLALALALALAGPPPPGRGSSWSAVMRVTDTRSGSRSFRLAAIVARRRAWTSRWHSRVPFAPGAVREAPAEQTTGKESDGRRRDVKSRQRVPQVSGPRGESAACRSTRRQTWRCRCRAWRWRRQASGVRRAARRERGVESGVVEGTRRRKRKRARRRCGAAASRGRGIALLRRARRGSVTVVSVCPAAQQALRAARCGSGSGAAGTSLGCGDAVWLGPVSHEACARICDECEAER